MESVSAFPFRKLQYDKYLTLNVLMHIDRLDALNFMFTLNKEARNFLMNNFITVRNEFVNEGLIEYQTIEGRYLLFNGLVQLEKLYFEAISRNIVNRNLTIDVQISDHDDFTIFDEVVKWIKAQQKHIKLKLKVKFSLYGKFELQQMREFSNSNHIFQLQANEVFIQFCTETNFNTLRYLSINGTYSQDLSMFKKLQILGVQVGTNQLNYIIPYFASQFSQDQFKRMQVNLDVYENSKNWNYSPNLEAFKGFLPRHIQFSTSLDNNIDEFVVSLQKHFNPAVCSFDHINLFSFRDIDWPEGFSNKVKKFSLHFRINREKQFLLRRPNINFVTDILCIQEGQLLSELTQILKIFTNITSLYLSRIQHQFEDYDKIQKIHLPQLHTLKVGGSSDLRWFGMLNSLRSIEIRSLKKIKIHYFEATIDPTKLTFLEIQIADQEAAQQIELLLPEMKALLILSVKFSQKNDPSQIVSIYNQCCRSLHTYQIEINKYEIIDQLVQKTIELMKPYLIQRSTPLNLTLNTSVSVKEVIQINQMLERDNLLDQKLKLQLPYVQFRKNEDSELAIAHFQIDKQPFLHKFISMKINGL